MFTGLVETTGRVVELGPGDGSRRLRVSARLAGEPVAVGESVAVDGVCLTVVEASGEALAFDVVRETLDRTRIGALADGDPVHLERALRVGDRLGGHWVQGHVDGVATVRALDREGGDVRLTVALPDDVARFVALKGSIAIDGVSLTVSAVRDGAFEVALIPETLRRTHLGDLRPGKAVHLEVDLLARYLERIREME